MSQVETRQRLVEAMSESMRERGIGSTAMSDVLGRSGVSAGSLYHFFPGGKDELAAAAIREVGMQGADLLASVLANAPSVADGASTFYASLIIDFERDGYRYGCPVGVPSTEASSTSEAVRAAAMEVFGAWVETFTEALEREGWPPERAAAAARTAIALYEGASLLSRTFRDPRVVSDAQALVRRNLTLDA